MELFSGRKTKQEPAPAPADDASKLRKGPIMARSGQSRMSVRGAFGPSGSLWQQRRQSSDVMSKAQIFQLDRCLDAKALNKIIYQMNSSKEARNTAKLAASTIGGKELEYNIEGFAQYLASTRSLNTLLFWKDTEEYCTLFGQQEREQAATKIFERYLVPGSEHEVTTLQGDHCARIKSELNDPPDDLFVALQQEAYGLMLFELFPNFWEAVKAQDREGGRDKRSKMTSSTTLKEILKANDLEIHLFAEYCREHLCEDSIIFLLETALYSLLFDEADLLQQGKRIYDTYLDPTSEGRIVVSDSIFAEISKQVKAAEDGKAPLVASVFEKVMDDVLNMLNMDVWPRYKEGVLGGHDLRVSHWDGPSKAVDMTRPSKAAVAVAMRDPKQLEMLRSAASSQGVKETVDFCEECRQFRLLFSLADRKPRATIIWNTYLQPGADTPVNLPYTMVQKVEKRLEECDADIFDEGHNEILQVISDNIFGHYLRQIEREQELAKEAAAAEPPPPKESGGCCLLM